MKSSNQPVTQKANHTLHEANSFHQLSHQELVERPHDVVAQDFTLS